LFNTSDPSPAYVFELAFRTQLALSVEKITLLKLNLDLPAYTITAEQITGNVDYNCQNSTSPPADQSYANLTNVKEEITTDATWQLGTAAGGFDDVQRIFGPIDLYNVTSQCLAFSPRLNIQVPAPKFVSDLTSGSFPGSASSPSKYISNGGAVGIFLATEILVVAIVVGAFWYFKSRHAKEDRGEEQHHYFKEGEAFGFLAAAGLAIMGVFKRKNREEKTYRDEYALRAGQEAEHNWIHMEPLVRTTPAENLGGMPQNASPAQYNHAPPAGNPSSQVQQQYQPAPISTPPQYPATYQSGYPQQQQQYVPAPTTYESAGGNIPWEEPRPSKASSPPRQLFRKAVPGEKRR